jgi:hypothetical protein
MIEESKLSLAVTWNPRGELARFERSLPKLHEAYDMIAISFPPMVDPSVIEQFTSGKFAVDPDIRVVVNDDWSWGRYMAIKLSLETSAGHIQYADMDRLLRWVETNPDEWRETIHEVINCDCLIIGRTEEAYHTHPRSLRETEAISNQVVSYFLGRTMDVSAGSKGFSRSASQYIIDHCSPGHALGTDAEWPIILSRAGFNINYTTVDGLTWESADRYQNHAVSPFEQHRAAIEYDADPKNWEYRVNVAEEIVRIAFDAYTRPLDPEER